MYVVSKRASKLILRAENCIDGECSDMTVMYKLHEVTFKRFKFITEPIPTLPDTISTYLDVKLVDFTVKNVKYGPIPCS